VHPEISFNGFLLYFADLVVEDTVLLVLKSMQTLTAAMKVQVIN
jgi:hypothetical protein